MTNDSQLKLVVKIIVNRKPHDFMTAVIVMPLIHTDSELLYGPAQTSSLMISPFRSKLKTVGICC